MMSSIGERASKKYFDDDTVTMEQGKLLCDIIDAEVAPLIEALKDTTAALRMIRDGVPFRFSGGKGDGIIAHNERILAKLEKP
jgi:hypothetical protein